MGRMIFPREIAVNGVYALATGAVALYNLHLQGEVAKGNISYQPFMGTLTDAFYPAMTVSGAVALAFLRTEVEQQWRHWGKTADQIRELLFSKDDYADKTLDTIVLGTAGFIALGCSALEIHDSYFFPMRHHFCWGAVACFALSPLSSYGVWKVSRTTRTTAEETIPIKT